MRTILITTLFAVMLSASADAQTSEVTDSGTFIADATGRYVRLVGHDGIVTDYLYDTPEATEPSGFAVHPNEKLTLTVRFDSNGGTTVAGLPKLTSLFDDEGRTIEVQADGKAVARFDYAPSGLFASATLPHFTWKVSAPDRSGHVRQSVENASGKVFASFVMADVRGVLPGGWYDVIAAGLGVAPDRLTFEHSPPWGTTARDAKGRVAFYVVHGNRCDVGFSPDGTPLFYDLTLEVFGGTMVPGSDVKVSRAWDAQGGAVPGHFVLTAGGGSGLYVDYAARKSIVAAWSDRHGKVGTVFHEVD
jgi:hypothetical protein